MAETCRRCGHRDLIHAIPLLRQRGWQHCLAALDDGWECDCPMFEE